MIIDISRVRSHAQSLMIQNKGYRRGQALFNALYDVHPEIADMIRGTPADPFYNNSKENMFWDKLHELASIDSEE